MTLWFSCELCDSTYSLPDLFYYNRYSSITKNNIWIHRFSYFTDDYFASHSSAQARLTEEDLMRRHAEKALAAFGSLKDSAVVMDMFIMKYVEVQS